MQPQMQEAACSPSECRIPCKQCHRGEGKTETKKDHCNHYSAFKGLGMLLPQMLRRWLFGSKELFTGPSFAAWLNR